MSIYPRFTPKTSMQKAILQATNAVPCNRLRRIVYGAVRDAIFKTTNLATRDTVHAEARRRNREHISDDVLDAVDELFTKEDP